MTFPEDDTPFEFPDPPPPQRPWAWIGLIVFVVVLLTFGGLLLSNRVPPVVAAERALAASATAAVVLGSPGPNQPIATLNSPATPQLIATLPLGFDRPSWIVDLYPQPNQNAFNAMQLLSWYPTGEQARPLAAYTGFNPPPPNDGIWVRVCIALDVEVLLQRGFRLDYTDLAQNFQAISLITSGEAELPWHAQPEIVVGAREALVRCTWVVINPEQPSLTLRLQVNLGDEVASFGWTFRTQP